MINTILFFGRRWKLFKSTPRRLIFHPASSDGAGALKAWRQASNLTQRAAAAQLGISQGQLARLESGSRSCPDDLMARAQKIRRVSLHTK